MTLCDPMDRGAWQDTVHEDSPGKNNGVGHHFLLQGNLPNSEIEPRSPALQADSLPSEPPGNHYRVAMFECQKQLLSPTR